MRKLLAIWHSLNHLHSVSQQAFSRHLATWHSQQQHHLISKQAPREVLSKYLATWHSLHQHHLISKQASREVLRTVLALSQILLHRLHATTCLKKPFCSSVLLKQQEFSLPGTTVTTKR